MRQRGAQSPLPKVPHHLKASFDDVLLAGLRQCRIKFGLSAQGFGVSVGASFMAPRYE